MLTIVILTFNEAVHIQRAIENVRDWATDVFVVDSHSSDETRSIAESAGGTVFLHRFENYALQREWALRSLPYQTEWMMFLDADELLSDDLKSELAAKLPSTPQGVDGFYVKRRFFWMGRWIRRGGFYPIWILRIARHARARCGVRTVNEHLEVDGATSNLEHDILHVDLKPLSDWIAKHNRYATLEAEEQLRSENARGPRPKAHLFGTQPERKQWIRDRIWDPLLPPLARPFLYFAYAYFFRLGFLDGRAGFSYHMLQGLCFRFMIEAKYLALKKHGSEAINSSGAGVALRKIAGSGGPEPVQVRAGSAP